MDPERSADPPNRAGAALPRFTVPLLPRCQDQLIPPALFAAMREAGPLPVAAPATAEEYWAERRALLERRLAEVNAKDRWTGFSCAFIHLPTGLPATDPRVVLTAVLADATNLGLTRMADACSVASYRKLAWTAGWHLREDTYRQALAILVNAQQRHPLAALFGAADVSSSDGQHFRTAGPGAAVGAINVSTG